jgi:RNA polymerase sigma-70 factor, ECF subfamily
MANKKDRLRFERIMLVHQRASYNLALWLLRDPADAEDVVQTAYMKAFEHFDSFRGGNAAGWMLTIVRNTAYNWLQKAKRNSNLISFDEVLHSNTEHTQPSFATMNPEETLSAIASGTQIMAAIERLPVEYREVFFLREIEGFSYQEIAETTQVPKGTVMSRLSRARAQLQLLLTEQSKREKIHAL